MFRLIATGVVVYVAVALGTSAGTYIVRVLDREIAKGKDSPLLG